jgi:hypothetical protein
MTYGVSLLICVFFLGSACGALLVSLQWYAHRAKVANELSEELCRQEGARLLLHRWLQSIRIQEIDPAAVDDRIDRWR